MQVSIHCKLLIRRSNSAQMLCGTNSEKQDRRNKCTWDKRLRPTFTPAQVQNRLHVCSACLSDDHFGGANGELCRAEPDSIPEPNAHHIYGQVGVCLELAEGQPGTLSRHTPFRGAGVRFRLHRVEISVGRPPRGIRSSSVVHTIHTQHNMP